MTCIGYADQGVLAWLVLPLRLGYRGHYTTRTDMKLFLHSAVCVIVLCAVGCTQPSPTPVGTWTVRHELKTESVEVSADKRPSVYGFSTTTITITGDGAFSERLAIELLDDPAPEPTEYEGTWQQDADVVRFKRNDTDATQSYVIDKQGLRMTGNVAGHNIVLTRQIDDDKSE